MIRDGIVFFMFIFTLVYVLPLWYAAVTGEYMRFGG